MATWCSPEGRVSCVICEAELTRDGSRRSRGSRGFLSPSVECCCANGASDDVCKSVHEPGHAGTHPHPLAQTVPCIVWCLVAARIWRHVLELCMWERYPRECSLVTQIGLSWLLPCIVTTGGGGLGKDSPNGFSSTTWSGGKISNHGGENDPGRRELQCVLFPLSWHGKLCHALLRKGFPWA